MHAFPVLGNLAHGQTKRPDLEASMAMRQHAEYERKGYLGRILVTLGSVALVADLTVLAQPLVQLIERLRDGLFAIVPALGLSFFNAARAILFDQIDYFFLVSRILVLFSALVALVVGTALWNSGQASTISPDRRSAAGSVEGDR
jgi:hypothetical protein